MCAYLSIYLFFWICLCVFLCKSESRSKIKSKLIRELLNHSCSVIFFPHFVGFYITLPHFLAVAVVVVVATATDKFQHTHCKREFRHLFCKYVQRFAWQNFHNEMCLTTPFACESIHRCRYYKNSSFHLGDDVNALENAQRKKNIEKNFKPNKSNRRKKNIYEWEFNFRNWCNFVI